jgi:hypothetical protein
VADGYDFIRERVVNARNRGHEYIQLVVRRGNSPKNWERARIIRGTPSLFGRCIGATGVIPGDWLFDVKVVDAQAWLDGIAKTEARDVRES